MRAIGFTVVGVLVFVGASIAACGSNSDTGNTPGGGGGDDGGTGDDATTGPGFGHNEGGALDGQIACEEQCPNGLICDHGLCEPPQKTCATNADCEFDSYCDPSGTCVPYGAPTTDDSGLAYDPTCKLVSPPGVFAPTVFCEFKPAANDPDPGLLDVQATPIVVNFNKPNANGTPSGSPSIVVPFTATTATGGYTETLGVLRILSGKDCSQQAVLGNGQVVTDYMRSSSPVAVGDLDGDGVAEIVAYAADDSTIAFTLKSGAWTTLWASKKATTDGTTVFISALGGGWAGPSIHDIDDDGKPEIIREGYVINGQTGVLIAPLPPGYASYSEGISPVLADLDSNGKVELINGATIWDWSTATKAWVDDPTWAGDGGAEPAAPAGWPAIADFNGPISSGGAQIAVASSSNLYVFNRDHSVYMGMTAIGVPGGGGGPPTIADYDGDGLPEVGLAGADFYTVFDPDCQTTPRTGGKCATAGTPACDTEDPTARTKNGTTVCPTYLLWSKKTQDHSSNITGSSVFDFSASGTSQVVYADECFARVYDGPTGDVLFSQYHSSCTWLENPVVADVDGDFHAELVVMGNLACATGPDGGVDPNGIACGDLDSNGVDQSFVGQRCLHNQDCVSAVCDQGYCRCTTSAQCCPAGSDAACIEQGTQCAPPPAGTPGTGNTCRAPHPHGAQGIRVYKDAQNRWVRSRMIWNQDAYAVTNTNEDGTIPQTSKWASNWQDKSLNNFRQNTPGEADGTDIGDVTAQAGPTYTCSGGGATLQASICNRGTAPLGANIPVGFYAPGGFDGGSQKVCSTVTSTALAIGQCTVVSCAWATPPQGNGGAVDVTVVGNDPASGTPTPVCNTSNNLGLVEHVFCTPTK